MSKRKTPYDRHHIFWTRNEWKQGELNKLRMHPYCIVKLRRKTIHKFLHLHLAYIPTPGEESVQHVLFHLQSLKDYGAIKSSDSIEKRLTVLIALFDCIEQPTADALREQLKLVCEFKKAPN